MILSAKYVHIIHGSHTPYNFLSSNSGFSLTKTISFALNFESSKTGSKLI